MTSVAVPTRDDMHALGRRLAAVLTAGDLVVLSGGLGAGKTTLTQGIGEGLGVLGGITSPTFVIARVHPSTHGGPALVHVDAYRLGSTMEFAGYDATLNPKRLELLRKGARHYLHEPEAEPVLEQWYGWRPMTPDSVPILDRSPAMANVWIAAGHNMLGLSMAPATGKLVAELIKGGKTHIEAKPYSLSRF